MFVQVCSPSPPELALFIGVLCWFLFKDCSAPLFLLGAHSHTTHTAWSPSFLSGSEHPPRRSWGLCLESGFRLSPATWAHVSI